MRLSKLNRHGLRKNKCPSKATSWSNILSYTMSEPASHSHDLHTFSLVKNTPYQRPVRLSWKHKHSDKLELNSNAAILIVVVKILFFQ